MAISLAWRLAIILTPVLARNLSSEISGLGAAKQQFGRDIWDLLTTPDNTAEELSALLSDRLGYTVVVTDYATTFELRLAQLHWLRDSGVAAGTDDAITTHHFIKIAAGAPAAWDDATDLAPLEDGFVSMWNGIKLNYPNIMGISQVRWYKAGPAILPPQVPVRVTPFTNVGSGAAGQAILPPQDALSVTEKTSDPKSWGRFYMPLGLAVDTVDLHGRFLAAVLAQYGAAVQTLYAAADANNTPAVVYSKAKPIRLNKKKVELPAIEARALAVSGLQIDDVVDVIRSRRWPTVTIRHAETG